MPSSHEVSYAAKYLWTDPMARGIKIRNHGSFTDAAVGVLAHNIGL